MLGRVALKRNRRFRLLEDELEDATSLTICADVVAGKACRDDYALLPVSSIP